MNVVNDREFLQLMKAGRPGTSLPSSVTVGRDVIISFERCRERIDKILKVGFTFFIYLLYLYIHFLGSSWTCTFCNGCLDVSKPSCFCGVDCSFTP